MAMSRENSKSERRAVTRLVGDGRVDGWVGDRDVLVAKMAQAANRCQDKAELDQRVPISSSPHAIVNSLVVS